MSEPKENPDNSTEFIPVHNQNQGKDQNQDQGQKAIGLGTTRELHGKTFHLHQLVKVSENLQYGHMPYEDWIITKLDGDLKLASTNFEEEMTIEPVEDNIAEIEPQFTKNNKPVFGY